ncbi:MAG: Do family serine endopeptidase [Bryobacteraceae bacterium]
MNWLQTMKKQKVIPLTLILATLAVGIVIGTLVNTGVRAERNEKPITDATPLAIPTPTQLGNDFTALVKKMEPAVVHVSTEYSGKKETQTAQRRGTRPPAEDEDDQSLDLFRRFFGDRLPEGMRENPTPRFKRQGAGSGFIVDPKGYIITNEHVVDEADKIKVKLHGDQTEYSAKLIGTDSETDVAVIKIDAGRPLQAIPVGNSDAVDVGDWAVAIGSPFGLEASVTAGIVSAKGRSLANSQQFQRFIQTDAAINPGNSGGPLLNIRGEVIGVNTMIATRSGGYEGIGFALPVNMAVKTYNQLIKYGHVTRGSIGISWNPSQEKPEALKALGLDHGVIVDAVTEGGPAEKAGVKVDDVVVAVNRKPVKAGDDLVSVVADTSVGEKVTVTVDRNGKKIDIPITVEDRYEVFKDDPRFARMRKPKGGEDVEAEGAEVKFGFSGRAVSDAERESLKLADGRGVMVTQVQEETFAEDIGLRPNDVIVSINREPVNTIDDIKRVQATLKPGSAVAFRVMRPSPLTGRTGAAGPPASFMLSGTLPRN